MPDVTPPDQIVTMTIPIPNEPQIQEDGTAVAMSNPPQEAIVETVEAPPVSEPEQEIALAEASTGSLPTEEPKEEKNKGGRPCTYCQNKEEYQKIADDYLEKCRRGVDGKAVMPYIEELAIELNTIDETILEWSRKKGKDDSLEHPEFSVTISKLKMMQKFRLKQRTMGRYNPTGAIFLLKANHGLMETDKQILAGDKNEPLQVEIIEEKNRLTDE